MKSAMAKRKSRKGFALLEAVLASSLIMLGIAGAYAARSTLGTLSQANEGDTRVAAAVREYSYLLYMHADSFKASSEVQRGNSCNSSGIGQGLLRRCDTWKNQFLQFCESMVCKQNPEVCGGSAGNGGGSGRGNGRGNGNGNSSTPVASGNDMVSIWLKNDKHQSAALDLKLMSCEISDATNSPNGYHVKLNYSFNDLAITTQSEISGVDVRNPRQCGGRDSSTTRRCESVYLAVSRPN